MNSELPCVSEAEVIAARPAKNRVDPRQPYAWLVEPERTAGGRVANVATVFLTNRECPFRCLMCDLWQNTTDDTVPQGAIPEQIDFALARLPPAQQIKLYNSGNFFDRRAIPPADHAAIAARIRPFENVIVENHPKLCNDDCLRFRDRIETALEIAIGLETVHQGALALLNKQMTAEDFDDATRFLTSHGIAVRAFILLRPPGLSESEGIEWALRSIEHAFAAGVTCCSVIPTRAGNGIMQRLEQEGYFSPPSLSSLEQVLASGIAHRAGRVFVDLWDAAALCQCRLCGPARIERLRRMNLLQVVEPEISCACRGNRGV